MGEQRIWRLSTNQELRELYKDENIAAGFKKKRLEWIGRVAKIDQGRRVKKYLRLSRKEVEGGEDLD
jgi:hypothetical protein